jgi:hypothetical protein
MRESCKSSGASKVRGSGMGKAAARGNSDRGRWRGGDDGADKWGPCGGDRGKGVAAGLRNYAKAAQAGMGRARVHDPWEGSAGESGRAESEEKFFSE